MNSVFIDRISRRLNNENSLPARLLPVILAVIAAYFMCLYMIGLEAYESIKLPVYALCAIACVLALPFVRECMCPELALMVLSTLWLAISRVALKNINPDGMGTVITAALQCSFFVCGYRMAKRGKYCLIDSIGIVAGIVLSLWSACGLCTALTGKPLFNGGICLATETIVSYVQFFTMHRNYSAGYFLAGLCLMLFQFFRSERRSVRIACIIAAVMICIGLSLQHCRSSYLSAGAAIAYTAALLVREKLNDRGIALRLAAMVGVGILCMALIFFAFGKFSDVIAVMSSKGEPVQVVSVTDPANAVNGQNGAARAGETGVSDSRSTIKDAMTLTGRTNIWKAMIPAVKEKPSILLSGQPKDSMMEIINRYYKGVEVGHMHNLLFDLLMLGGLPVFFCWFAVIALLLWKAVKCLLEPVPVYIGCMAMTVAAICCYGLFEPVLRLFNSFTSAVFCTMAGALVGAMNRLSAK